MLAVGRPLPESTLGSELQAALKATERSFHVRLIGTFGSDLVWAPPDAEAASWLADNSPDFDQFPVRDGDVTVGLLHRRSDYGHLRVRDVMDRLCEGLIVAADMPIADLIPQLRDSHARLVLRGVRIDGVVTQSDLLKLPVRMLLFGLITHLEMCLRALVRERAAFPIWLDRLSPPRRRALRQKLERLKAARLEPDPLEFSNFSDVVDALAHEADLGQDFRDAADSIRNLRNEVAHAQTFITSTADVQRFVARFDLVREWIERVSRMLSLGDAATPHKPFVSELSRLDS